MGRRLYVETLRSEFFRSAWSTIFHFLFSLWFLWNQQQEILYLSVAAETSRGMHISITWEIYIMAPNIASSTKHVHFDDTALESGPSEKKETVKTETKKTNLKQTSPAVPPTENQIKRDRMKAEFLRGALGRAPSSTKPVLDTLFAAGKKQSSRLKPEMMSSPQKKSANEQADDSETT